MQVEFVPGGKDHGWYFKDGNGCVLMAHGEPVPLLVFCERESKALLEKKTSAGRAYENHIAWLEDQLAKARTSTGGSRELVAAAISIRDRLVDYFRYVADRLPFERAAEANERAQALINGLGLLASDLEAGRLADQCTRLHRNQLLGELDEARLALDASQGQVKQLEAEVAELRDLADRQAGLLSRTAVAIRGPEPDLARWSHHDLPELAAAMRKQRDICASAANKIQWATPDYSHQEGVCPECGQYEHDGHGEGCMVGRACGIYDVLRLTGALK